MRFLRAISLAIPLCFFISAAEAEVFFWTDENGIKHFSNVKPPPSEAVYSENVSKAEEIPYDREADLNRLISERMAREERRLRDLKDWQAMAEDRLRATNRKAEALMEEAEELSQAIDSAEARDIRERKDESQRRHPVYVAPKYGGRHSRFGYGRRPPVLGINPMFPPKTGGAKPVYKQRKQRIYKSHMREYYRKHGYMERNPSVHGPGSKRTFSLEAID